MLDQSMRLILEEEGEGPPPVDWDSLAGISPAQLPAELDFVGQQEFESVQIRIGAGEKELRFLFIAAESGQALPLRQEAELTAQPSAARMAEFSPRPSAPQSSSDWGNLRHLLDVKIPLRIRLGTTRMNLEDILRIAPGTILELDRREDEPLEVLANGRVIARGEVVVVDERFGLKITEIGSSSDRLQAAG
jgi:flagellar motor switch protein FliN